jgi:hypothetical protein
MVSQNPDCRLIGSEKVLDQVAAPTSRLQGLETGMGVEVCAWNPVTGLVL